MAYKVLIVLKDGTLLRKDIDLLLESISWVKLQIQLQRIRNIKTILIVET